MEVMNLWHLCSSAQVIALVDCKKKFCFSCKKSKTEIVCENFSNFLLCLQVAELVTNEFFEQGDMERRNFNITPIVIKKNICTKDYTIVIYSIFKFYFIFFRI